MRPTCTRMYIHAGRTFLSDSLLCFSLQPGDVWIDFFCADADADAMRCEARLRGWAWDEKR